MANNEKNAPAKKETKAKKPNIFVRIGKYFKDVWGEVKKVTWPTPKELVSYTVTVLVFIAIFAVIIGVLDLAFSNGLKLLTSL